MLRLIRAQVQIGANPVFIFVQMWALCGRFPGFTKDSTFWSPKLEPGEGILIFTNVLYALYTVVTPLILGLNWWYWWVDFSVGFFYVVVETIHAYVMIKKDKIRSGELFPGLPVHPDLDSRWPAWVCFAVSSSVVVSLVYVVIPNTIYGWYGLSNNFFLCSDENKGLVVLYIEAIWMMAIPTVRNCLLKFSPMPDQANMIVVMHPQLHKAISKRLLLSNISEMGCCSRSLRPSMRPRWGSGSHTGRL